MLVYVATPYRADTQEQFEKQVAYTKQVARKEVQKGNDVIVPHLYYPLFLNDEDNTERRLGMLSALALLRKCEEVVVGVRFGISEGMSEEIRQAEKLNIKIREID